MRAPLKTSGSMAFRGRAASGKPFGSSGRSLFEMLSQPPNSASGALNRLVGVLSKSVSFCLAHFARILIAVLRSLYSELSDAHEHLIAALNPACYKSVGVTYGSFLLHMRKTWGTAGESFSESLMGRTLLLRN
jgi:hypothetical protein